MDAQVIFTQTGGPDVLQFVPVPERAPAFGEVLIKHSAIGLNFIDTYYRSGLYPVPLPSGLGNEGAGEILALGQGVQGFKIGDRVAYGTGPLGAYATQRHIHSQHLVKLPAAISDETGAAMMLKGMTACYLLRKTYGLTAGETILFHAVAGGVGLLALQWAKALGARVIGTVSSVEKKQLALQYGCDHVIVTALEDTVQAVRDITNGEGVPVVYDGIGQSTFLTSLDCLARRGLLVSFGNASGAVSAFNLGLLASKGSLYVTRPTLGSYTATPAEFNDLTHALMAMVQSGHIKIPIHQRYPLRQVAQAHEDLESRKTTGTTIFIP